MITIVTETFVPGQPKTKGSMRGVGGGNMIESVAGSTRWRMLVAERVRRDRAQRQLDVPSARPVGVRLVFWVEPPVSLIGTERAATATWIGAGDVDKLARNVLDALTDARAYADDNQVVRLLVEECVAAPNRPAGVLVQCWELNDLELRAQRDGVWFRGPGSAVL